MSDFPVMQYQLTEPDEILPDIDAHGYLQGVYRGQIKPNGNRLRAAIAALPFERPKLGVTVQVSGNDLAERLMQAIAASQRITKSRPMQVIEHAPQQVDAGEIKEELDHGKPFAGNSKSRFNRF